MEIYGPAYPKSLSVVATLILLTMQCRPARTALPQQRFHMKSDDAVDNLFVLMNSEGCNASWVL